ncbi:MAG TPA: CocE/NonD family hydrolase, partial [Pyrinomonadaceae bacterium]
MNPSKFISARVALVACLSLVVLFGTASAQEKFDVKAVYQKREYRIPMRDGAKLFTSVYMPKDASRTYPIMFNRTPYTVSPYGEDAYRESLGPSEHFMREGYIFV